MTQIERDDIIWAAGFFDGEGYVGISGKPGGANYKLRATVTNCDPRPVEEFKRMFGGSVTVTNMAKYNPRARTRYTWEISGRKVSEVLQLLLPFFRDKQEQAELAISFADTLLQGQVKNEATMAFRDEIDQKLRALKTEVREPTKENVNGGI